MAATDMDEVARDSMLDTANQISWSSNVVLDVVADSCRARQETGTVAYFLWRIFGAQCPFVAELTGLLTWSKKNQVTFDGRVKKLARCNGVCGGRLPGPGAVSELLCSGVNDSRPFCPWLPYPGVPGPTLTGIFLGTLTRVRTPSAGVEYSLAPTGHVPPRCWPSYARQP